MNQELFNLVSYYVEWIDEDEEFCATCNVFPSLSYLDVDYHSSLRGIQELVQECIEDLDDEEYAELFGI